MPHEIISIIIAALLLGLLYLGLALGPWAKRMRQRQHRLPEPDPYPPSPFPTAGQKWFAAAFVTFFFLLCYTPSGDSQESAAETEQPLPTLIGEPTAQAPEAPASSPPTDQEQTTPENPSETSPAFQHAGGPDAAAPPPENTERAQAEEETRTLLCTLQDSLSNLLLFSPLFIIFSVIPTPPRKKAGPGKQISLIILCLGTAYIISALYNLSGLPALLTEWTQAPELQQVSMEVQGESSPLVLAGMSLSIIIVAPVCEEICFRGFIFNSLVREWGMPIAAAISGILFGAIHYSLLHLIPLSALGILLAVSYYRSRTVWTPIVIHAIFNAIGVCSLILMA